MNGSHQYNGNKTISMIDETIITSSPTVQASDSNATYEGIAPIGVFNLTDRLQIFTYLVTPNRVRWYRVIMRTFLQHHRELYRYQLTAQEVRDAVRVALDPEYTLDQCQNDLAALKEWGN